MVEAQLLSEKQTRQSGVITEVISPRRYSVCEPKSGKSHILNIWFDSVTRMPQVGDKLYYTKEMTAGIKRGLHQYSFSARIGEPYARKPHNFEVVPEEFLIVEYSDGEIALLEQWYG